MEGEIRPSSLRSLYKLTVTDVLHFKETINHIFSKTIVSFNVIYYNVYIFYHFLSNCQKVVFFCKNRMTIFFLKTGLFSTERFKTYCSIYT